MITVFTPTYNRKEKLFKCYKSLCQQSCKDFIWLIVDDGSTDGTKEWVQAWQQEKKIDISYYWQENKGKHVAHNQGVLHCQTDLFICVDSDDYLMEQAIEDMKRYESQVLVAKDLAGVAFLKGDLQERKIKAPMPQGIEKASIWALYEQYNFKGELALLFKTEILKHYLFPVFEGEKFVGESVVYDQISDQYEMLLVNQIIYLYAYYQDGYTQNVTQLYKHNPKGYLFYLNQCIERARDESARKKAKAYYIAGCLRIGYRNWLKDRKDKKEMMVSLPRGIYIYLKVKIREKYVTYYHKKQRVQEVSIGGKTDGKSRGIFSRIN